MGKSCAYFKSSVGKKQLMALSGLALCGFLFTHLLGNFLIMVSDEAFNSYAHKLITNPLIFPAEIMLAGLFIFHIFMGIKLTLENKKARPTPYAFRKASGEGSTFASSTMPYTGMIILFFLVYHLINFKYGPHYLTIYEGGVEMRDLHRVVMEYFQDITHVIIYIFCMLGLGLHLSHGFQSAFKSLGLTHPKYTPWVVKVGYAYAIFITVGFSSLPIWCYLKGV